MALVVLLKGVNVGGHRTFRPSAIAKRLKRFDTINLGAAGTFVVRRPVGRMQLRAAIRLLLPFEADIMICDGREILQLASRDPFVGQPSGRGIVRFVSVIATRRDLQSAPPFDLPATGRWGLRVLAHQGRFVLGLYRREMKAISYLGQLEQLAGQPVTTRNWNTILALAGLLKT